MPGAATENPPYVLHMRRVSAPDPAFLDLEDEHQLVARLTAVSLDPWEIVLLHSQVGKELGHRKVLKHELLALEALEARESELRAAERAFRNLKKMTQPCRPKRRRTQHTKAVDEAQDPKGCESDSISGSSTAEGSEEAEADSIQVMWKAALKHAEPSKGPLAGCGDQPAAHAAEPEQHVPRRAPGGALVGGTAFPIAEIRHHGKVIGWGVTCGRHWNADDHGRTPCKRAVTFGNSGLSKEELQRRLKRWWVAGTYDTTWPDNGKQRTHHVKMGGTFLRDFASGEWQDLTDDDLEKIFRLHRETEDAAD